MVAEAGARVVAQIAGCSYPEFRITAYGEEDGHDPCRQRRSAAARGRGGESDRANRGRGTLEIGATAIVGRRMDPVRSGQALPRDSETRDLHGTGLDPARDALACAGRTAARRVIPAGSGAGAGVSLGFTLSW
jgi:hypothetical protein